MADYDLTTVANALAQNFRPRIVSTFNRTSLLLRLLRIERGEGKNCAWTLEEDGANAENFSDGQDVSAYGIDEPHAATLDWGLYRSNFKITNLARAASRTSRSPEEALRPMARRLVGAMRKLASTINAAGYAGAGTGTTIAGLALALDDANEYAGINRTSSAYFRAKVFDPGSGTDPTIAQLRKDIHDIKDICGESPDIALCPSSVFLKIAGLFDNNRHYQQDVTLQLSKGAVNLDASVGKVTIDGCTFIADKDATAGTIYYLNSEYVYWQYLPSADEEELPEDAMQMPLEDGMGGPIPLGANIYALARTGAARKVTCETQMQLVVENPKACGVRKNVNGVT